LARIACPNEDDIWQEYEDWGRTRFHQGIPSSEIVCVLMITKKHLRKFIRVHGLADFCGDRVTPDELMPVELYAIQELNYLVGEFFDCALYHLVRGYEVAAGIAATFRSPSPSQENANVTQNRLPLFV